MVLTEFSTLGVENPAVIDQLLYSSDIQSCLEAIRILKNSVIGSNKQKSYVIQLGILPRLMQILLDENSDPCLLAETAITLGSLAKGSDEHVKAVIDAGAINILLGGLFHSHSKYVESCLRCLRTILLCMHASVESLYSDHKVIPRLVQMARSSSVAVQESVMSVLSCICKTTQHQNILCTHGAVEAVSDALCLPAYKVQMPALKCLSNLCFQNAKVSEVVGAAYCNGQCIPDILVLLMCRDKSIEMQLASAKCLTYIFRAGALSADDPRIVFKALPTLVRMCQKDVAATQRVEGAETLAYLTEVDTELQRIASISDHLIPTLSELLKCHPSQDIQHSDVNVWLKEEENISDAMKRAAFRAFSSLAANDEEIRKKIIDTDSVMENIVCGLSDQRDSVRLAAVRCLHSLSRSVQQLRTTFQDHAVWRPLMKLLQNASDDVLTVASSTLCNLLLEFSPSKEPILECGAVELLCGLTRRDEPALRLNGVWALMNMAFQADQKIKSQILSSLGSDQIFHLLTDSDVNVLMKTLGLLRNLLSTKPHIDHIMGLHGKQVMQAVILILEGDQKAEVKEQALCILANIADGDFAKNFIMSNEDVLKKLTSYMMHSNVKLQIASTFCISNLIWKEDEGALERQTKLKDFGVQQLLQQLITTTDTTLFDKCELDAMRWHRRCFSCRQIRITYRLCLICLDFYDGHRKVKTALQQFPAQGSQQ